MGSVIYRSRFSKEVKIKLGIFAIYLVAALAFIYFGLQPATTPEEVYAKEAESAITTLTIPTNSQDSQNLPVKKISKIGKDLEVPEQIVGTYSTNENKTLLIGHSSTAFKNLKELQQDNKIIYNGKEYTVATIEEKPKQDISMKELLKSEERDTIILMTCSGEKIANSEDYTHRLIITAS